MQKKLLILDTEACGIPEELVVTEQQLKNAGCTSPDELQIICQLAYAIVDPNNFTTFEKVSSTLCKPDIPIAISATEKTKIKTKDVVNAPKIYDSNTFKELKSLINSNQYIVCAHNIDFDAGVLKRCGLDIMSGDYMDTLQVAKLFLRDETEYTRLSYLIYKYEIDEKIELLMNMDVIKSLLFKQNRAEHDALFDVISVMCFIECMMERNISVQEMIKASSSLFEYKEMPFGAKKGELISSLSDTTLLYYVKTPFDERNLAYTLENEIERRGGYDKIIGDLYPKTVEKYLKETITNEKLLEALVKRENSSKSDNLTFKRGKHAGKTIHEVPLDYLSWYIENVKDLDPYFIEKSKERISFTNNVHKKESKQIEKETEPSKIVEGDIEKYLADMLN